MIADLEIKKREVAPICKKMGVSRLVLFGSQARGDSSIDSDIDLWVNFNAYTGVGAFDRYFDFKDAMERVFSTRVDLLSNPTLQNPYLRTSIEASSIVLYEG